MKVEIEPQFAKNLLAYLADKPIKEAMGAYNALALEIQVYERRQAEEEAMPSIAEQLATLNEKAKNRDFPGRPDEEDAA
jgi:hypothetical protein